jgi:hypothetical protein
MVREERITLKRTRFPNNGHPGRKSDFVPEMIHEIEQLARLGASNEDIAEFYRISQSTVEVWFRNNPRLYEAKKRGSIQADMQVVDSLWKNANGYDYTKTEKVYNQKGICISVKQTTERVKGDTTAQIFWLTNRQPEYWRHQNRITHEHSGDIKHSHYHKLQDIPIEELSEDAQKMLFEVGMKQLSDGRGN